MDDGFKERAAAADPEMGNLSSLLLMLVHEPSPELFRAVMDFTRFAYWQQPTVTVACALLPHLDEHLDWKAHCLHVIGNIQMRLSQYRTAVESVTTAAQLNLETNDLSSAARCKRMAGDLHRILGEVDRAESLLIDAYEMYAALNDELGEARCRRDIDALMLESQELGAAVKHLTAARQTFERIGDGFGVAQCSELLGTVSLFRRDLESASTELEASRAAFADFGDMFHQAQSTRVLSSILRTQGEWTRAERLLNEAEYLFKDSRNQEGLAACAWEFGRLRIDQGRQEEAIAYFESATNLYVALGLDRNAEECREMQGRLQSAVQV